MATQLFILISTINERILNILNILQEYNKNIVYIVSHQIDKELNDEVKQFVSLLCDRKDVIYTNLEGKGVAKNRNNTLRFIKNSAICLILDDDVVLCENTFDRVKESFKMNASADFISFKILDLNGNDYKTYPKEKQWHTLRTLTGIGTTEMAFKSDLVLDHDVKFDERFGPGAEDYPLGEDFIFAMDLYRAKAKMLFLPIPIVKHPQGSTGSSLEQKVIFARGAVFARTYGVWSYLLDIIFTLKHKKMYYNNYTMPQYLKLMLSGSCTFRNKRKKNIIDKKLFKTYKEVLK